MIYGYVRVSSIGQADGTSLENQEEILKSAGAERIFTDVYSGVTNIRPELNKLMNEIRIGDQLIVTKMDRLARSLREGIDLIEDLIDKGIVVNILNIGIMDDSPSGKLIRNIFLSFAEFERETIADRMREGKAISGNYGGRRRKYTKAQLDHAMELLERDSYSKVAVVTGISRSTLIRECSRRRKK